MQIEDKTIKIRYTKSVIKQPRRQKDIIRALGFRKLNQVVIQKSVPSILGMIRKVAHLVAIEK